MMDRNDPDNATLHDKIRAKIESYDTEAQAREKLKTLHGDDDRLAASNTGGAGFEWIFALFGTPGGRRFLAGVTLSVLTAWGLFHVWIVAPSPTGFAIPAKAPGPNWDRYFRIQMTNAGIKGNALERLMGNCSADSCTIPPWKSWEAAIPRGDRRFAEHFYCQAWDKARVSPESKAENKVSLPPSADWTVIDVSYKDGLSGPACVLRHPISYIDFFWFKLLKSLVVVAIFVAGLVATGIYLIRRRNAAR